MTLIFKCINAAKSKYDLTENLRELQHNKMKTFQSTEKILNLEIVSYKNYLLCSESQSHHIQCTKRKFYGVISI